MSKDEKEGIQQYCCDREKCRRENYDKLALSYIDYYHKRATISKWSFLLFNLAKIILIGMLPVFQMTCIVDAYPWIITALASGALIMESIIELWRLKEKWILYRSTCSRLMAVQRQYAGKTQDDDPDLEKYVADIELIISEEGSKWLETFQDKTVKKDTEDNSTK